MAFTKLSLQGPLYAEVFSHDLETLKTLFEPVSNTSLEQDSQFMLLRSFVTLIGKSMAELEGMGLDTPIVRLHKLLRKAMR